MIAVWASHHEELCRDDVVASHVFDPWLALNSGWRLIGATHLGQQWTPVLMLPHMRDGLSSLLMEVLCTFLKALQVSPRAPRINAQRLARFDHYCTRNCLSSKELRRNIQ
jgi:hypothetical protein